MSNLSKQVQKPIVDTQAGKQQDVEDRAFASSPPSPSSVAMSALATSHIERASAHASACCSRNSHASIAVLTNSALWDTITECMTGFPLAVHSMHTPSSITELKHINRGWAIAQVLGSSTLHERGVLVHLAIAEGNVRALKVLHALTQRHLHYKRDPKLDFRQAMRCAVLFSRVDMLTCIAEFKAQDPTWRWEPNLMRLALQYAERTSVGMLEWIHTHAPREMNPLLPVYMRMCATKGKLELVQWLLDRECEIGQDAIDHAAINGHAHVLALLLPRTRLRCTESAIDSIASLGHLDVMRVILEDLKADDERDDSRFRCALNSAARCGHLEVVKLLVASDIRHLAQYAIDYAAKSGYLDVVTYLHEHCPAAGCSINAMDNAAMNGHLDIFQFLHTHRREGCSVNALSVPIQQGRLDVVEVLHANYPHLTCTQEAFDRAAQRGHLDVVKFLHSNRTEGCSSLALTWAARAGHLDVVQFLCEHRTEGDAAFALREAEVREHAQVAAYLQERLEALGLSPMDG